MTNLQSTKLTPGDLFRVLSRQWKKAFVVFSLVVIATLGWILLAPEEYQSSAKVYVKVGRENNTLDPTATTGQTLNIQQTLEAEINSMLAIIGSSETASLVAADVGVDAILSNSIVDESDGGHSAAQQSMMGRIKNWFSNLKDDLLPSRFSESREDRAVRLLIKRSAIWSPKKSNVIEISCTAGHPELAQQIVSAWTDAFIQEHLRVTRTEGSLYFFDRQTEEIQRRLLNTEEQLREVKSSSGLVSIEGHRKILEEQAASIRTRSMTNNSMLQASQAKLKELISILDTIPLRIETDEKTTESDQGWNALREKLFELQIREFELKSKKPDTSPEVIAVVEQRKSVEAIMASQSRSTAEKINGFNPTYALFQQSLLNEQALVASLLAEKRSLEEQRQENLEEIKQLNANSIQIADLERQLMNLDTSYRESAARTEQARTLQSLETANISSISKLQHASFNSRPTGLGRSKLLLLGMLVGVVAGMGWATIAEMFDRSFVTPSQVELALDLPVLASVPHNRRQLLEVGGNDG